MSYDARTFCRYAISVWDSEEPELLEWAEEIHNCMAILAQGGRAGTIPAVDVFNFLESVLLRSDAISEIENAIAISFIEYPELSHLNLNGSVTPRVKEVLKIQHERW